MTQLDLSICYCETSWRCDVDLQTHHSYGRLSHAKCLHLCTAEFVDYLCRVQDILPILSVSHLLPDYLVRIKVYLVNFKMRSPMLSLNIIMWTQSRRVSAGVAPNSQS